MGRHEVFEKKDGLSLLDKPEVPAELVKLLGGVKEALQQLDSKGEDTKRNALKALENYEVLNATDVTAHKAATDAAMKKAEEADRRVKDLETTLATKGRGIGHNGGPAMDPERDTPQYKSFYGYLGAKPNTGSLITSRNELESWQDAQRKDALSPTLLRTDNMMSGGYLVPPVTDGVIRKKVVELSPVRRFAMSRSLTSKNMSMPIRRALLDSYFEGETEDAPSSESRYGEMTVTAWRQGVEVSMTTDQLMMSPFDMENEIASDVGQSFAKKEGYMFLKGSGDKQPSGIMTNSEVQTGRMMSATAGKITFDDIANLIGTLKSGYSPALYFNRYTFAQLVQLKDTQNRPLWQPVAGDKPATIWDQPYTSSMIDMDSMAAGAGGTNAPSGSVPIMFADLMAGFEIYDLMGMSVIRDDVTAAKKSIVIYNFRRWLTSRVTMPEAIKILKVA
jgi:HK97 family phage major capsid protein